MERYHCLMRDGDMSTHQGHICAGEQLHRYRDHKQAAATTTKQDSIAPRGEHEEVACLSAEFCGDRGRAKRLAGRPRPVESLNAWRPLWRKPDNVVWHVKGAYVPQKPAGRRRRYGAAAPGSWLATSCNHGGAPGTWCWSA